MINRKTLHWIWLAEACGPESALPIQLYALTGDIDRIYDMKREDYAALEFLKDTEITALCDKDLYRAKRIEEVCGRKNIGILALDNPLYPDRLRKIHCPPAVLYYRGYLPDFDKRLAIAVVGTRGMSDEGRISAYRIAFELSVAGAIVVSGMALGIDGTAQTAALDAEGTSIAVLGTAIDRCYPQEHKPLYDRLLVSGGILSEYAPGCDTHPWHFPQRNRIISGLCQGTVVVEAGVKSGALITAQTACMQGRNVFAMPGDANNPACVGTNNLIKAGALPVTVTYDILSRYKSLYDTSVFPENIGNPTYFYHYDDRLKYGAERIAKHAEDRGPAQPPIRVLPHPPQKDTPNKKRTAPADMTAREEPILPHDTDSMREDEPVFSVSASEIAPLRNETEPNVSPSPDTPAAAADSSAFPDALEPQKREELTETQSRILDMVRRNMTFDEICAAGFRASDLMVELTLLELSGYIVSQAGGHYRCSESRIK